MLKKLLALCITAGFVATAFAAPPKPPFDKSGIELSRKANPRHHVHHVKHHRHHRHHRHTAKHR